MENSRTNGFFARGPGMFYFWPVNLYFGLPEWKFYMVFSRFPAALVIFGQFSGNWRCGSGGGWEVPEKALKMVSGWHWGVKIAVQSAHWQKGDRNGLFGGIWRSYPTFSGGPYGKRKAPFYKKNSGNSRENRVLASMLGTFYFWPINLYFTLPEPGFGMLFCYFTTPPPRLV